LAHLSLLDSAWRLSASAAAFKMNGGWVMSFQFAALFLMGLANAMSGSYSLRRLRDQTPPIASALWGLWALGSLIAWFILLPHMLDANHPITLSSPYPEIAIVMLVACVLWFAYAIYQLMRRRAQYLETTWDEW
jgi:drug/metabolite transporter (DMT)-like permease